MDKLTYDIFSILESNFLLGNTPSHNSVVKPTAGKVRILSIDSGGANDGILSAAALAHLESSLRRKSGNPTATIADFFDVVAGSGAGGILAALLFTRGKNGRSMFTTDQALKFMVDNRKKIFKKKGILGKIFICNCDNLFKKIFKECSLRHTLKSVLIPCYDLTTRAAFVFSRSDAVESDEYDFLIKDVCAATMAAGSFEMRSVDGRTKIGAVDGGIAMSNPTAAAITHVLNNKHEFPLCNGVEDLLVVSLGNGESDFVAQDPARLYRVVANGSSDLVDQAVSMAFAECRQGNYVRIQASGMVSKKYGDSEKAMKCNKKVGMLAVIEEMLAQKNVESVLFKGKKISGNTNLDKLEFFASELVKEEERRKNSILSYVMLTQLSPSPRTSSATLMSTVSSC